MSSNFTKFKNGVSLFPQDTNAVTEDGDIRYNSSTDKIEIYNGAVDSVVSETKAATLTNKTLTSPVLSPGTASVAVVTDGSGQLTQSATTATQIGYLNTTSSNIQTQLNNKTFDNLSPMTTGGDIIYGGASGAGTRLANGSAGQVLTSAGTTLAPAWATPFSNPMNASGDIIYGGTAGAGTALHKGTDGQFLSLASGIPAWASATAASLAVSTKTTTYTAQVTDDVILCDTSGGGWTLALYAVSGTTGKRLIIKKTTSDTNTLTINPNASETIDGQLTQPLYAQYEEITIVSNGSTWEIVDKYFPPAYISSVSSGTIDWPFATDNYGDIDSLAIPGGEWDLTAIVTLFNSGSVSAGDFQIAISGTSGNSSSGIIIGTNTALMRIIGTTAVYNTLEVSNVQYLTTGGTTRYLKGVYHAGFTNLKIAGWRISARRVG